MQCEVIIADDGHAQLIISPDDSPVCQEDEAAIHLEGIILSLLLGYEVATTEERTSDGSLVINFAQKRA